MSITLKTARKNLGMTQQEVAKKININNKTVSLCDIYNISIDDVILT